MQVRVAESGVVDESVVDGPGIRMVVFTQGCPHRCPGCHNPGTHPQNTGTLVDTATIMARFAADPLLSGITFSGGEPFLQAAPLCEIARFVRAQRKTIVTYTGYTFEELAAMADPAIDEMLDLTDLLIDGPYRMEERDLTLRFCGSRNQRLLTRPARAALAHTLR